MEQQDVHGFLASYIVAPFTVAEIYKAFQAASNSL